MSAPNKRKATKSPSTSTESPTPPPPGTPSSTGATHGTADYPESEAPTKPYQVGTPGNVRYLQERLTRVVKVDMEGDQPVVYVNPIDNEGAFKGVGEMVVHLDDPKVKTVHAIQKFKMNDVITVTFQFRDKNMDRIKVVTWERGNRLGG